MLKKGEGYCYLHICITLKSLVGDKNIHILINKYVNNFCNKSIVIFNIEHMITAWVHHHDTYVNRIFVKIRIYFANSNPGGTF